MLSLVFIVECGIALCVYFKLTHHPYPHATSLPNFVSFVASIAEIAHREKSRTHSLTHSPILFDARGTLCFGITISSCYCIIHFVKCAAHGKLVTFRQFVSCLYFCFTFHCFNSLLLLLMVKLTSNTQNIHLTYFCYYVSSPCVLSIYTEMQTSLETSCSSNFLCKTFSYNSNIWH